MGRRLAVAVSGAALMGSAVAASAAAETWRFTHARPLAEGAPPLGDAASLRGQLLRFSATGLEGPRPFSCTRGRLERLSVPARGLFEGGLAEPVSRSVAFLGLGPGPYGLRRLGCVENGADIGFDFVEADAETLLVALDGRIWTLSRAPGALAAADSPEGRVQRLLEAHFAGSSAFLPPSVADKSEWLSAGFQAAARTYFARPRPQDEVPPIDGDPFANTQEPLTHFAVDTARTDGAHAVVPVRIAAPREPSRLEYRLVREAGAWKLDDVLLHGDRDSSLRRVLEQE